MGRREEVEEKKCVKKPREDFFSTYQSISFWSFQKVVLGHWKQSVAGWAHRGDETQDLFLVGDLVSVSDVE